jgi:hypothetical protein
MCKHKFELGLRCAEPSKAGLGYEAAGAGFLCHSSGTHQSPCDKHRQMDKNTSSVGYGVTGPNIQGGYMLQSKAPPVETRPSKLG